jgi:hypothetical protein
MVVELVDKAARSGSAAKDVAQPASSGRINRIRNLKWLRGMVCIVINVLG